MEVKRIAVNDALHILGMVSESYCNDAASSIAGSMIDGYELIKVHSDDVVYLINHNNLEESHVIAA